jgi:hypothetical protein
MKIKELVQDLQDKYLTKIDNASTKEEAVSLVKELIISLRETFKNFQIVKRPLRKTGKSRTV